MLSKPSVTALRMERQYFQRQAGAGEYPALFRAMSPVAPAYWNEPGSPPTLPGHAAFDDGPGNDALRARRELRKGRFGGLLSYVTAEDWELFCCLYQKPIPVCNAQQQALLGLLEREGPMNIGLMKEFTGMLAKEITPALHKLQEACLVFEDQCDKEWDRPWCLFSQEFPEISLRRYAKEEALALLIRRFAGLAVFVTGEMLRSFYRLPAALIRRALDILLKQGRLVCDELDGQPGYLTPEDRALLETRRLSPKTGVQFVQRNDFWVRANARMLKERFSSQWETLAYLLADGEFHGSVEGKFKFGPHLVEDILLDLPALEAATRRAEVLEALNSMFDPRKSPPARFCSEPIQ